MIPKVIHYCWFGKKNLTNLAQRCIKSWTKFFPNFEIKEWNEYNFDINLISYTAEAYKSKKYAFVSDFARYWILYNHGGLYFDTDVEVIRNFDDIINAGPFLGIEQTRASAAVNPGLGMGAIPEMEFYRNMIEMFSNWRPDLSNEVKPLLIKGTTDLLKEYGWKPENKKQFIEGITIYPNDFFNPLDDYTGKIHLSLNTHSIHFFAKSWVEGYGPFRNWLSKRYHRVIDYIKR